jgi:signal transduction histidine kinase
MTEPMEKPPDLATGSAEGCAAETNPAAFGRVLVVDDLAENRELLQAHLENAGYHVVTAANGQEALTSVGTERPDLILLDLVMPGVDGFEVCRRLKADAATAFIPIIIVTALSDFRHRLQGIEVGADEFLTKPFNALELVTRVRSLLRTKHLHDQVAASNRLLEQKVAERTAALEHALADLRAVDRFKSEFLANLSHELRTPLTPIQGYLPALLEEVFGRLTVEQREVLDKIAANVDRLHRLIDDLLAFMEWESGQVSLSLAPMPVATLVEAAGTRAMALAREKGVRVSVEVSGALPPVPADAGALSQALGHLLENAVKFTPPGGHVTVGARRAHGFPYPATDGHILHAQAASDIQPSPKEYVELAVQDTGVGIPPEALPRIFDRFYQVDSSSTREHGGTGLGLAIVKRIVDAHGASIAVESRPGQGTIFLVRLPVATE